ncbi:MAG: hypothetical protein M0Z92_10970 [Actinomycetota bacterium]|nr:hypothetical protein [Actinomycetota bacterium]
MAMREECKHFQSRTYDTGDVARFCVLDLAPEAPWRCPADCPKYERRLADVAWKHGSLVAPRLADPPEEEGADIGFLLDQAEDIVNEAAPEVIRDFGAKPRRRGLFRRRD